MHMECASRMNLWRDLPRLTRPPILSCPRRRQENMKTLLGVPLVAVILMALSVDTAVAGYCGACRYRCCATCCDAGPAPCKMQCHTVMRTCKEVVYEKQNYTCYKTVMEPVVENRTINCCHYVQETAYRDCCYTVCKPVWETKTRDICYTVCKPVYE